MTKTVAPPARPRRERLRAQTYDEIRERALAQLAAGGVAAVSLNAIAKTMGMSGPALYRYYASRDELLAALVVDSYDALADAMTAVADKSRRKQPVERFKAITAAYRSWALEYPYRYRLVFGHSAGSGALDPAAILPAADRVMAVLLDALTDLDPPPAALDLPVRLQRQLRDWHGNRGRSTPYPPTVVAHGLLAWTRLHGIVSLEIEGVYTQVGVDPADLYAVELERILG